LIEWEFPGKHDSSFFHAPDAGFLLQGTRVESHAIVFDRKEKGSLIPALKNPLILVAFETGNVVRGFLEKAGTHR